jgi:hypothetical protein
VVALKGVNDGAEHGMVVGAVVVNGPVKYPGHGISGNETAEQGG